jgi:hypothetical protein
MQPSEFGLQALLPQLKHLDPPNRRVCRFCAVRAEPERRPTELDSPKKSAPLRNPACLIPKRPFLHLLTYLT